MIPAWATSPGALDMVGGVDTGAAAKMGMTGWKAAATAGAIDGAWQGAAAGGGGYLLAPGPHTVDGLMNATATGTVTGTVGGAGGGALSHGVTSHLPSRSLGDIPPTPLAPVEPSKELVPYWPPNRGAAGS